MSAAFTEDFSTGFEAPRPRTPKLVPIPGVYGAYRFTPEHSLVQGSAEMMTEASQVMPQEPIISFSMPFDKNDCRHQEECEPDKMILSRPLTVDLELYRGDSYVWPFTLWADEAKSIPVNLLDIFPQFAGKTVAMSFAAQLRSDTYEEAPSRRWDGWYPVGLTLYSYGVSGIGGQYYGNNPGSFLPPNNLRRRQPEPKGAKAWATIEGQFVTENPENNEIMLTLTREEALKVPTDVDRGVWDLQVIQQEVEVIPAFSGPFEQCLGGMDITRFASGYNGRFYRTGYPDKWSSKNKQYKPRQLLRSVGEPAVRTLVAGNVTFLKDVTRHCFPALNRDLPESTSPHTRTGRVVPMASPCRPPSPGRVSRWFFGRGTPLEGLEDQIPADGFVLGDMYLDSATNDLFNYVDAPTGATWARVGQHPR